jgi:hypothetical protein
LSVIAFTELRPADRQGRPVARHIGKTIDANGIITAAPQHTLWQHQPVHLSSIVFAHQYLVDAQKRGVCLIRGLPASNKQPMRRWLAHRENRGDHGFVDGPGVVGIAMDIDGAQLDPAQDWITDPDGAVDSIVSRLPEPWSITSYVWMFTATHGLIKDPRDKNRWTGQVGGDTLRVRVFFLADRPIAASELEPWFRLLKAEDLPAIDDALGRTVQPCYLIRPKLIGDPGRDPLGTIKTSGLTRREHDTLIIPDDLPRKIRYARATGATLGTTVQHPDTITAIRAIGTPINGSQRGEIHAHLKSAVFLMVRANPRKPNVDIAAQAEDVAATVKHEIQVNYLEIVENLQAHGRRWEELAKYLRDDTLKRLAIWRFERVNQPRRKRGQGRHKLIAELRRVLDMVLSFPLKQARQRAYLMAFDFFVVGVYGWFMANDQLLPPLRRTLFAGVGIGKSQYMRAAVTDLLKKVIEYHDQQAKPAQHGGVRSSSPSAKRRAKGIVFT